MLQLIFRFLTSLYFIFFPVQKLKKAYFISCIVQTLCIALLASSHIFPEYHGFLLTFGMSGLGAGKGTLSFISLVLADNLNGHPNLINLVFALGILGDSIGLLLNLLLVYHLEWNWSASMMIYNGLFLASSILVFVVLKET